jgi:hypothetical protein
MQRSRFCTKCSRGKKQSTWRAQKAQVVKKRIQTIASKKIQIKL